jgi:glycosyl transferase-like sugar-binding protein
MGKITEPDTLKAIFAEEGVDPPLMANHKSKILGDSFYRDSQGEAIPLAMHHIWFTTKENSREPNDVEVELALKSAELNRLEDGWKHYFWVNDKNLLPKTVEKLEKAGFITREIWEIVEGSNFSDLIQQSIEKNFFGQASDIARYSILKAVGGVYLDFDYELFESLLDFNSKYTFYAGEEPFSARFVANSFLASKPEHPILSATLGLVARNLDNSTKPVYFERLDDNETALCTSGPIPLSISFFNHANQDQNTDIVLPSSMCYPANGSIEHMLDSATDVVFESLLDSYFDEDMAPIGRHYWHLTWLSGD